MDATPFRRPSSPAARRLRGQSTVVVLGLAAVLAGVFLYAHAVGERVAAQQRLITAADAAAFGGAVWQARTLNFQAYANRAIVANEAALAQAVSLRAWSAYMDRSLANLHTVTGYVPYLGQATAALRGAWRGVDAAVQPAATGAELAAIAVSQILAQSQPAVHVLGQVAAEDVARRTLAAHGAHVGASAAAPTLLARNAAEWQALTTTYAGGARHRLKAVVDESRDTFTHDRGARFAPLPASLLVRLEKRGGTELVGYEAWQALDTLALHRRSGFLFGRFREAVPVGWGAAADALHPARGRGHHGGAWTTNPRTARLADATLAARTVRAYPGLPAVRDVADPRRQDARELRLAIEARDGAPDPIADPATLGVRELPGAQAPVPTSAARSPRAHALAVAAVRFERPEGRADGRREHASLYNPYWVARLAAPASAERALAAGARGVVDPFAGLAP